ncbi:rhomboid family intramembrane serine protease [Rhodococcoides fascians]|uniref:rhomboid family intramembrane serine protease n=1 Tax=Rhodococcoides fascians TaxID=1828 RepID=UPI0009B811CC|nr:rhomboid family intramembrane serine protease [Rhodococcus fascians]
MNSGTDARSANRHSALPTFVVASITTVVSVVAFLDSSVMDLLVRNRPLLESGQWWRAVTPVLVQPDGWGQFAFNLLGTVLVGIAAQRRVGPGTWLCAYAIGGVGSVAIYSMWHPADTGGGSSAAVAALIGVLVVTCAVEPDHSPLGGCAQVYAMFFAVYLTALDIGGVGASVVAGNASIVATVVARRGLGVERTSFVVLSMVALTGITMTVLRDDHGTGILIGLAFGILAEIRRRRSTAER